MQMNPLFNKRSEILLAILAFCTMICTALFFYLGSDMGDLLGQWKICAYTLRGYDPFALAISGEAAIGELGTIPSDFSTVPWACILGNIFYPGFLSFEAAKGYITMLQLAACVMAVWLVYIKCREYVKKPLVLLLALSMLGHFCFVYSWSLGNNGAIICCLIIAAICIADGHPYLAGVLVGFSMVKPQIAAIVCIAFLLNKKYKVLVVGAAIDILGWAATSMITATPFVELLRECLLCGTSSARHYYGVLSPLTFIGTDKNIVLLLNAVLGIAYTYLLWRYLKKNGVYNTVAAYVPACIASTIWTYKNGPDYMMVVLATIMFLCVCLDDALTPRDFWISAGCILCLQLSRLGVNVIQTLYDSYFVRTVTKSAEGVLLMAIGVIFCVLWVKYQKAKKPVAGTI